MGLDSFLHSLADGYLVGQDLRDRWQRRKLTDLQIKEAEEEAEKRKRARAYLERAGAEQVEAPAPAAPIPPQPEVPLPKASTQEAAAYGPPEQPSDSALAAQGIPVPTPNQPAPTPLPALGVIPQRQAPSFAPQAAPAPRTMREETMARLQQQAAADQAQLAPREEQPATDRAQLTQRADAAPQAPQADMASEISRAMNARAAFGAVREASAPVPAVRAPAAQEGVQAARADSAKQQRPGLQLPEFDSAYADRLRRAAQLALQGGDHDIATKYMSSYADYVKQQADVYDKFVTTNLNPLIREANRLVQEGALERIPQEQRLALNALLLKDMTVKMDIARSALQLMRFDPEAGRVALRKVTGIDNLHDLSDKPNVLAKAFPMPADQAGRAQWEAKTKDILVAVDKEGRPILDESGQPIVVHKPFLASLIAGPPKIIEVSQGASLVSVDSKTGKATPLYQAPSPDKQPQPLSAKNTLEIGENLLYTYHGYNKASGMSIPAGLAEDLAAYYEYMRANPNADPAQVARAIFQAGKKKRGGK